MGACLAVIRNGQTAFQRGRTSALLPGDLRNAAASHCDQTWRGVSLVSAVVRGVHAGFNVEFPGD